MRSDHRAEPGDAGARGHDGVRREERFSPESLDEVAALLLAVEGSRGARMRGSVLVVESEGGEERLAMFLDLSRVPELNRCEFDERLGLRLGAALPLRDVAAFPPIMTYPILTDGMEALLPGEIDSSLGEALERPERAGHLACPLICVRASAAIFGPHGWSELALEALFAYSDRPVLQPREFVVDLRLPAPLAGSAGGYVCHRAAGVVRGAAAFLVMEEDRCTCCGVRLGLWSETLAPVRVLEAERFLAGRRLDERSLAEAVAVAADASGGWEIDPPPLADAIRRAAARHRAAAAA